jgi:hypothetical protein
MRPPVDAWRKPDSELVWAPQLWEARGFSVNQGPSVLHRNSKVFISDSSSTGEIYAMGLLWADVDADLLDPASWTKSPEPVLRTCYEHAIGQTLALERAGHALVRPRVHQLREAACTTKCSRPHSARCRTAPPSACLR